MGITVHQIAVGGFDHNFSYLAVAPNGDAFLVDPTGDVEMIHQLVASTPNLIPRYILLTHGHLDHMQALGEALSFFPAPVVTHPKHPIPSQIRLRNQQHLPWGGVEIEAVFTPGHSLDSVCYRITDDSALFTGDVLFIDCIGFCRSKEMYRSLTEQLLPLPDSLIVYPGHDYGSVPYRTLGEEKKLNPFLNCPSLEEFKEKLRHLE